MANVDFTEQIADFREAVHGEDVRDSLIDIAEAVETAINNQLISVDDTLTESGQGADAKKVGDEISSLKSSLDDKLKGHTASIYTDFNPITNNTVNTKLEDGVYRIVTDDNTNSSSCYYSTGSNHALYNRKVRLTIKNNAQEALNLYKVQFAIFEGTLSSTNYAHLRQRITGEIKSGDLIYYDYTPSQMVSDGALCSAYLFCPANVQMDITVSFGVLEDKSIAVTADNNVGITIDSTAIIAEANNNIVNKKITINADWTTGTVIKSGSVYIRQYRPYSMISRNLNLNDYFGGFIHVDIPDEYEYRPVFFSDNTFETLASQMNSDTFVSETSLFIKTPYVVILARRKDESFLSNEDLTAIQIYADMPQDENLEVFGNYCDESSALVGYTGQSATGWMLEASNRILSDWIRIPESNPYGNYMYDGYKYTVIASKISGEWGYNFNHCIFYDENKQLLSAVTSSSQAVLTNKSAKYVRAIFANGSTDLYVGFNSDGSLPEWEPYRPIVSSDKITCLADSIHNSDGAVTSMLRTCLAYAYNDEFGYGNHYTAYHESCGKVASDGVEGGTSDSVYDGLRYQLDCSAFVRLALQNILPENSRYMSDKNSPNECGHVFNNKAVYDNQYGRLTANKLAKYAYDNGWLYAINSDMSNVEVGDLLFLSNQNAERNFFQNIGHTVIVMMKWKNTETNEYRIRTIEAKSSGTPIYSRTLSRHTLSTLKYGARIPLRYCSLDVRDILSSFESVERNVNLATNSYTEFDLPIERTIKANDIFTVCIKADIPQNTHFELYAGDNALGLTGANVWYGNSGEYTLYGFVMNNYVSAIGESTLTLRLVAESTVSDTVKLEEAKVIRGYYSPSVREF